ncbi:MAG: ABC transporter permease, partial [Burkholderiales bacterium]
MWEPLKPVSRGARAALGAGFFVLFLVVWAIATFGGFIPTMFLKDPLSTLHTGIELFTEFNFIRDIGVTIWRVMGGFIAAVVIGVPIGILMGAYKPVEAFLEPFVSFARYI